jgi:hypothetical protein
MNKSLKNKKELGMARILIYPEKDGYIGVCLDLDIIEEAKTKKEVTEQIKEATEGYIINVCKNNLDDSLLNRPAPEKYWKIFKEYNRFVSAKNEEKVKKVTAKTRASSLFSFPISDFITEDLCINS